MDMNKYICQTTTKRLLQSIDGRKEDDKEKIEIISAVIESLEKEDEGTFRVSYLQYYYFYYPTNTYMF